MHLEKSITQRGNIPAFMLAGSVILSLISFVGFIIMPLATEPIADMRIEPTTVTTVIGDVFTVQIIVESTVPVNAFAGELTFNSNVIKVESIDYNTGIADLWAELPWYSNGDGSLNFAGGTTHPGGFVGTGTLITVTFRTIASGEGMLNIKDAKILQHDGLGSDTPLEESIGATFLVKEVLDKEENLLVSEAPKSKLVVMNETPSSDFNNDGSYTITDVSIFMSRLFEGDRRGDLNQDGTVNATDLSIVLSAVGSK